MRRSHRNLALATVALAIIHIACGRDRITLQAPVADLRRTNSLARNKHPGDFVEITVPGRLLTPPAPLIPVARANADWSTVDRAAASILSAKAAGDVSWILQNTAPAERDEARRQLSDPAADRTRNYYRNIGKVRMLAWAQVRGLTVVCLQGVDEDGDSSVVTIALTQTPAGWKETSALPEDDILDVVMTAFRTAGLR